MLIQYFNVYLYFINIINLHYLYINRLMNQLLSYVLSKISKINYLYYTFIAINITDYLFK